MIASGGRRMPCTHDYTCAFEASSGAAGRRCQLCGIQAELPVVVALELPPAAAIAAEGDSTDPWAALGLRMGYPYVEAVLPHGPGAEVKPGLRLTGVLREGLAWAEAVDQLPEADVLELIKPTAVDGTKSPQQPRRLTLKFAPRDGLALGSDTETGISRSVGALRELDPGAVGAKSLSQLDAVMTLSRVSFDAHRHAPSKATRLDAINKLVTPEPRLSLADLATACRCALTAACLAVNFSAYCRTAAPRRDPARGYRQDDSGAAAGSGDAQAHRGPVAADEEAPQVAE